MSKSSGALASHRPEQAIGQRDQGQKRPKEDLCFHSLLLVVPVQVCKQKFFLARANADHAQVTRRWQ